MSSLNNSPTRFVIVAAPAEAYDSFLLFAREYAMNSLRFFEGIDGLMAIALPEIARIEIGMKSVRGLYGAFAITAGLTTSVPVNPSKAV